LANPYGLRRSEESFAACRDHPQREGVVGDRDDLVWVDGDALDRVVDIDLRQVTDALASARGGLSFGSKLRRLSFLAA